ncbi:MAG TPA: outer membrane beta-barrel protein [Albitalea sp.]
MRNIVRVPSLCLWLAACPALAQTPWYVGASAGQSAIDASSGEIESGFLVDDAFTAAGTTLDRRDTGWKLYGGYRFNEVFAAEAGYVDLGKASFNTTIVDAPAGTSPTPPFPINATATARGVFLSALAQWPLVHGFSVFAKAGAFRSEAEFTERITTTGATRVARTQRRTDANYGIGVRWAFTDRLSARLELERFRKVGRGIGGREGRDVDFASVGVVVQF